MSVSLVLLDRDGVINDESRGLVLDPKDFHFLPGAKEAIVALTRAGMQVSVVTNQSCIARGTPEGQVTAVNSHMCHEVSLAGGRIDAVFYCPHDDRAQCLCRKPRPGLVTQALSHFQVAPSDAILIGDAARDLEAATLCGVSTILVRTGKGKATEASLPATSRTRVVDSLVEATRVLLEGVNA